MGTRRGFLGALGAAGGVTGFFLNEIKANLQQAMPDISPADLEAAMRKPIPEKKGREYYLDVAAKLNMKRIYTMVEIGKLPGGDLEEAVRKQIRDDIGDLAREPLLQRFVSEVRNLSKASLGQGSAEINANANGEYFSPEVAMVYFTKDADRVQDTAFRTGIPEEALREKANNPFFVRNNEERELVRRLHEIGHATDPLLNERNTQNPEEMSLIDENRAHSRADLVAVMLCMKKAGNPTQAIEEENLRSVSAVINGNITHFSSPLIREAIELGKRNGFFKDLSIKQIGELASNMANKQKQRYLETGELETFRDDLRQVRSSLKEKGIPEQNWVPHALQNGLLPKTIGGYDYVKGLNSAQMMLNGNLNQHGRVRVVAEEPVRQGSANQRGSNDRGPLPDVPVIKCPPVGTKGWCR